MERAFPEQRLFLRSDTETRFIRLSPLTQFVGVPCTWLFGKLADPHGAWSGIRD